MLRTMDVNRVLSYQRNRLKREFGAREPRTPEEATELPTTSVYKSLGLTEDLEEPLYQRTTRTTQGMVFFSRRTFKRQLREDPTTPTLFDCTFDVVPKNPQGTTQVLRVGTTNRIKVCEGPAPSARDTCVATWHVLANE